MKKQLSFLMSVLLFSMSYCADGGQIDVKQCKTWEELTECAQLLTDGPDWMFLFGGTAEDKMFLAGVEVMPSKTEVDQARKEYILKTYHKESEWVELSGIYFFFPHVARLIVEAVQAPVQRDKEGNIFDLVDKAQEPINEEENSWREGYVKRVLSRDS